MIKNTTADSFAESLKTSFEGCADFNMRYLLCNGTKVYLANIGAFSGRNYLSDNILRPLAAFTGEFEDDSTLLKIICTSEVKTVDSLENAVNMILSGCGVVFADTLEGVSAYACMARNDAGRSVSEPESEKVVRGSREGFIEKAEDNVVMLRKRLRTTDMKVINLQVGDVSGTTVKIVYLKGAADERLVSDVKKRIENMPLSTVMDSGYIEQFLVGGRPRIFTEVGNSEKPDKVAAKIAEGRIAVICDGSPVVLTVPYLFIESLQSAEDYLKTPYYATFIRCLRFVSMLISLYLPAFYIAVMEHHSGAIPFSLYRKMSLAREDVPFSIFGELIVILLIFEIIREVGVRIPGPVGHAVSIVGGLILGDAAISAGISSAPVIMVASLTAICTFISPPFMNSTVLIRFANIFAARFFGVIGIAFSSAFLIVHLSAKTSFGSPYMYPFVPFDIDGEKDGVFMNPREALKNEKGDMADEA